MDFFEDALEAFALFVTGLCVHLLLASVCGHPPAAASLPVDAASRQGTTTHVVSARLQRMGRLGLVRPVQAGHVTKHTRVQAQSAAELASR
jgi:hypothetical protein